VIRKQTESVLNEAEALRRCRAGDREAFRWLVEEYGDLVRRTAYLIVRNTFLAEDLAQEAFLHAWRGMGGLRTEAGFKPWVMRILLNRIASHGRRNVVPTTTLEALTILEEPADPEPGPAERAERAEWQREMAEAMSFLPFEWRQAILLRYYAELSIPEIAAALDWPEGTAKSRIHRGLEALRRHLPASNGRVWAVKTHFREGSMAE
jgi:RNA polymerase sigma-70 factor, ECF subfamily